MPCIAENKARRITRAWNMVTDNFTDYIDSLGKLDDDDLYLDIDETMKIREAKRLEEIEDLKSYTSTKKQNNYLH